MVSISIPQVVEASEVTGATVGVEVGVAEGTAVGDTVGLNVTGEAVGEVDGALERAIDGLALLVIVGMDEGSDDKVIEGPDDGAAEGC